MPWYSAGTVTVTNGSPTVTGSGTEFSANVRVGDAFRGPDGGWYEVTNVASATVLSINPPYESANAAGAPYRIAPIQGYVKESADRLRMIVEQWGAELGELGEMSAVGQAIIQAVDAAAQRALLGLGTAAVRGVVGSSTDASPDRVMVTGSGGMLGRAAYVSTHDVDSIEGTIFRTIVTGNPGTKPSDDIPGFPDNAILLPFQRSSGNNSVQIALALSGTLPRMVIRHQTSSAGVSWSKWAEVWTDAVTTAVGRALAMAENAAAQRDILGLGTAATLDSVANISDSTDGRVTTVGWAGWGQTGGTMPSFPTFSQSRMSGAFFNPTKPVGGPSTGADIGYSVFSPRANVFILSEISTSPNAKIFHGVSSGYNNPPTAWREILHSGVTAVDSNGFIKNASPITKLYADHVENNEEAQDVTLQKESTGVYRLITERRLATEGWYIETPKDANGNIKVFIRYENTADGILIETFEPDYSTGPVTAGAPVDIPDDRWIDIRMTYTQAEIDAKAAAEQAAEMEAVSEESEPAPFGPDFQYDAQNVIESTENNPQEADPDE